MLIIKRRKGESFLIGDNIEVVVFELHKSHVKIAVRAPRDVLIVRSEVTTDHGEVEPAPSSED